MKEIDGYNGDYKINESGIVINKNGHVMRTAVSNSGYLRTSLEDKYTGIRKNKSIHRLVAETFIPNPENLPIVMHLDNDPLNNHVSNLKWGTQSDNIKQAFKDNRKVPPYKNHHYPNKYKVFNDDTGDIIICDSRSDVSDLIGYAEISLKNMIGNGRKITLGPYKDYEIIRLKEMVKIKK